MNVINRNSVLLILTITFITVLAFILAPMPTQASESQRRVVLIQVDAVRADFLDQFLDDGTLPANGGFATLRDRGFKASGQTVITPSVTSPNMTTMVTGAYPQNHGVIANTYPPPTATVTSWIYAHQQPLGTEGLWIPALQAGKKVGLIRTVGINSTNNAQTNTWTLDFHVQDTNYKLFQPAASDWQPAVSWNLGAFSAYSPRVVTFTLQDASPGQAISYTFNVVALDQASGGTYDALVLDDDHNLANGYFGVRPAQRGTMSPTAPLTTTGNWTSVIFTSTNVTTGLSGTVMGAYIKLYNFTSDLSAIKLYLSSVWHNPGYPRAWVNQLYHKIGPFPRLDSGLIGSVLTDQDGRDFAHREDNFFLDAALHVLALPDWDMLIVYQGIVDGYGHAYTLTDPRQLSYTNPISQTYWGYIQESYQSVDKAIATISDTVGLAETDLFVASDHGMAPDHTQIYINRLLRQNGISVTWPITAYARTGGSCAHIYINTTARQGGIVPPEQYTTTQDLIVSALSTFTDTTNGVYVFDNMIRHQDLATHKLYTNNSGDIFVTVLPGYTINSSTSAGPLTAPVAYGGSHGLAPHHTEMRSVFLAAGPHIKHAQPRTTQLINVAPTIAEVLGLAPLPDADGTAMDFILNLTLRLYFPLLIK